MLAKRALPTEPSGGKTLNINSPSSIHPVVDSFTNLAYPPAEKPIEPNEKLADPSGSISLLPASSGSFSAEKAEIINTLNITDDDVAESLGCSLMHANNCIKTLMITHDLSMPAIKASELEIFTVLKDFENEVRIQYTLFFLMRRKLHLSSYWPSVDDYLSANLGQPPDVDRIRVIRETILSKYQELKSISSTRPPNEDDPDPDDEPESGPVSGASSFADSFSRRRSIDTEEDSMENSTITGSESSTDADHKDMEVLPTQEGTASKSLDMETSPIELLNQDPPLSEVAGGKAKRVRKHKRSSTGPVYCTRSASRRNIRGRLPDRAICFQKMEDPGQSEAITRARSAEQIRDEGAQESQMKK